MAPREISLIRKGTGVPRKNAYKLTGSQGIEFKWAAPCHTFLKRHYLLEGFGDMLHRQVKKKNRDRCNGAGGRGREWSWLSNLTVEGPLIVGKKRRAGTSPGKCGDQVEVMVIIRSIKLYLKKGNLRWEAWLFICYYSGWKQWGFGLGGKVDEWNVVEVCNI